MSVEEKMTSNFLLVVTEEAFLDLKVKNINFLFPIKGLSVGFLKTFAIEDIPIDGAYLYINRILDTEAICILKEILTKLDEKTIGLCFTDLGVLQIVKGLGLSLKLIYMQNHNATNVDSINYYLDDVDSVLVSTDITKEEMISILDGAKKPLVIPYFMLADAMYSRRTLLTNFQEEFALEKKSIETLHENMAGLDFLGIENEYGTVLYAKKYIDYRFFTHPNIAYSFINPLGLDKKNLEKVLDGKSALEISNTGFLYQKTYYRLKEE